MIELENQLLWDPNLQSFFLWSIPSSYMWDKSHEINDCILLEKK